jgi:hypothetical protein
MSQQKNLMHINSPTIALLDSLGEYQRVFINDAIGKLSPEIFKIKRSEILKLNFDNIDDIWATLEEKFNFYGISEYKSMVIDDDFLAIFNWSYESTHVGIFVTLSASSIKEVKEYIENIKKVLSSYLVTSKSVNYNILQNDNGSLHETTYQDILNVDFNPIAVPFISDVDRYIENFLNAKAPILILQGSPGTGKTTFVKYILQAMQKRVLQLKDEFNVTYSFDEELFYSSDFYKQLIFDDYDVQVYEDINQVLYKNQEAELNPINKFLSVTDGLISKYKKIIITTNIESKSQLNPALLRPGRCFDVLEFRNLEGVEIDNLCDSCAQELTLQTESISLSEFFAKKDGMKHSSMVLNRVGF